MTETKKRRTKREYPRCNPYDIPAMEQWLEEKAAAGWRLKEWPNVFEEAEPCECRFSIQPTPERDGKSWSAVPAAERQEVYGEFGWEYVCTTNYNAFQVWRSVYPDSVPMNTDPEADSYAYDHLWKELSLRNGIFLTVSAAFGIFIVSRVLQTGHILVDIMAGETTPFLMLLYAVIALSAAWGYAKELYAVRSVISQLKDGVTPMRKACGRRGKKRMGWVVCILLWFLLVFLLAPHEQRWLKEEQELQNLYLSAEELGQAAEYGPFMLERKSLLGAGYVLLDEGGWDLAGRFPYQRMIYLNQIEIFEPKPAVLADLIFWEIANGYVKEETGEKAIAFTQTAFEEARYFCSDEGVQHLVAKDGGRVLYFRTESPKDLREYLPRIREILDWEGTA